MEILIVFRGKNVKGLTTDACDTKRIISKKNKYDENHVSFPLHFTYIKHFALV